MFSFARSALACSSSLRACFSSASVPLFFSAFNSSRRADIVDSKSETLGDEADEREFFEPREDFAVRDGF